MAAGGILRGVALAALAIGLTAAPTAAQDLARGAELYELCAQCHGTQGEGNQLVLAPAIGGLESWYTVAQVEKFKGGLRGTHPEDVAGLRMHPMARALKSDEDIQHVAAYVATLPVADPEPVVEGGDATRGAELYAPCVACHGANGGGNQALLAPALHTANDWYLVSSLQRYKSGVRGWNTENVNAILMRGLAGTLTDEQAIKDVVAYIMTLNGDQAN